MSSKKNTPQSNKKSNYKKALPPVQQVHVNEWSWKNGFMLLGMVALGYGLWKVGGMLIAILTAVVIASFVDSIADALGRFKVPRILGIIFVYLIMFGAFGGLMFFFIPQFITEITDLLVTAFGTADGISGEASSELYSSLLSFQEASGIEETGNTSQGENIISQLGSVGDFSQSALQALNAVFGGALNLILIIVISFYLAVEDRGIERFFQAVTPVSYENNVISLWLRTKDKIGSWFKGQLLSAFILGLLTYLGLWLIGVPYALMLALLAMVMGLIPFGILIAGMVALMSALGAGGIEMMLWTLAWYFLLQMIENYILQPVIINKATGLPSVIVLLSVVIGAALFGFMGLLLAIPLAVFLLELVRDFEKAKNIQRG